MKLELSRITGILVDKWYQPKPDSLSSEDIEDIDGMSEEWYKFESDNEIYLFPSSEIKGLKYGR